MHMTDTMADNMLYTAITAVQQGNEGFHQVLDQLPAAIYVTNAEGVITYYNRACIAFAGRTPLAGQDSWCVTWKLTRKTAGSFPMISARWLLPSASGVPSGGSKL